MMRRGVPRCSLALLAPILVSSRCVRPIVMAGSRSAASRSAAARGIINRDRPKAKQSLGQNFLEDDVIAKRIAGALDQCDAAVLGEGGARVVEMGPGQGALTKHLFAQHPKMTAVEIDKRMVALLSEEYPSLELMHMDMLALELGALADRKGGRLALVSNTPFYLTSQILFKIVGAVEAVDTAVLTMQLEVAEKILAPHGCKQYGILAVMLQLFGRPTHLFDIPPEAFSPAPKCTVAVVRFDPTAVPPGGDAPLSRWQRERLLALLKLTFEQRRKMLRVTLKPLLEGAVSAPPPELLAKRPEQLSPQDFLELAETIFGAAAPDSDDPDDDLAKISAAHASDSWQPHKAGWVKSSNKAASRPLATGEYPKSIWDEED